MNYRREYKYNTSATEKIRIAADTDRSPSLQAFIRFLSSDIHLNAGSLSHREKLPQRLLEDVAIGPTVVSVGNALSALHGYPNQIV